jgi:hypothetical protein
LENKYDLFERRTWGVCEGPGIALVFLAPVVDRLPKKHTEAVIAHELAHVFQASKGTVSAHSLPEDCTDALVQTLAADLGKTVDEMKAVLTYMSDPNESDADTIAKRWGYNARAMRRWVSGHIRWEDLPPPIW